MPKEEEPARGVGGVGGCVRGAHLAELSTSAHGLRSNAWLAVLPLLILEASSWACPDAAISRLVHLRTPAGNLWWRKRVDDGAADCCARTRVWRAGGLCGLGHGQTILRDWLAGITRERAGARQWPLHNWE